MQNQKETATHAATHASLFNETTIGSNNAHQSEHVKGAQFEKEAFRQLFETITSNASEEQLLEYAESECGGNKKPREYSWIREDLAKKLKRSPEQLDAIVSHKPPKQTASKTEAKR